MNWNPMMGPLGASASQSPDLGALVKAFAGPQNSLGQSGVTLGNPEAQDQYRQMAEAFVMQQRAAQDQEAANALQESGWINNSGALGVLDQVVKAYASKKLAKRADEKDIEAREKFYLGEEAAAERKAQREAEREMAQRGQRAADAERYGLQGDARTRYILEGKMGESPRDRLQALEGVNGPGIVNLDQGTVRYAQPEAQREQQLPPNVHIDPNLSPQERAAALAAEGLGLGDPHGDVVDVGRVRPQPTGQFITAAAAQRAQQERQQAANNARADEQLRLSQGAARRADEQFAWQKEQAAKKDSAPNSSVSAMQQDALNFAAAYIGKSPEDVAKMTPEQIRSEVAKGGRVMAGPIAGKIPGAGLIFNADLEAYANSAAGKQARLNNPTGPVSNADFDVARKSVFSPEKPAEVNADLIYQALTRGRDQSAPAPATSERGEQPQRIRIKL